MKHGNDKTPPTGRSRAKVANPTSRGSNGRKRHGNATDGQDWNPPDWDMPMDHWNPPDWVVPEFNPPEWEPAVDQGKTPRHHRAKRTKQRQNNDKNDKNND